MRAPDGTVRHAYAELAGLLDNLSIDSLVTKQNAAEELFRRLGITFAVYAEGGSTERLIPFDLIPRILDRSEWDLVERGCIQRVKAINVFLYDIYHDQEIVRQASCRRISCCSTLPSAPRCSASSRPTMSMLISPAST